MESALSSVHVPGFAAERVSVVTDALTKMGRKLKIF